MKAFDEKLYEFVFKGLLTQESLDRAGRRTLKTQDFEEQEIARALSIEFLDDEFVEQSKPMAVVYVAIASFENSVRDLVCGVLLESKSENWWTNAVPEKVRNRAEQRLEDEKKTKWHTQRGLEPINYTTMGDLLSIMRKNWEQFEPHIQSVEWASSVFDAVERSRNVIMHSGVLDREDIERLGIYIRDWIKQVGT